jgi:septal ring factor EnvC (AmiA/AmiB activator)
MCKQSNCQSNESCSCGCDCCGQDEHFERRYQTKAEKIAELESYLNELKTEVQAVEEHLADLHK